MRGLREKAARTSAFTEVLHNSGMEPLELTSRRATESMAIVQVENGLLRGKHCGGAYCFKGIPYAADTGGRHRLQAPAPVATWTGVRDALLPGDRSPQPVEMLPASRVFSWYAGSAGISENCCMLNVFTPALDGDTPQPVIFYVHGGGYASGGSDGPAMEAGGLAAFGNVVVVTVNHRLNLFGYTNLSHLDPAEFGDAANAGHLDLIAALRWVKRNIRAFGGDPGNVTLCGQSGGGNKVMGLLVMPEAQGLFRRAINMSGVSGLQVAAQEATHHYVDAMLSELGIAARDLRRLQEVPVATLQAARHKALVAARQDGAQPVVDNRHIHASPFTADGLALHASVPLLLGTTDTEATLHLGRDMRNFEVDEEQLRKRIREQFNIDAAAADALLAVYRTEDATRTAAQILGYLTTDVLARVPLLRAADAKADAGGAPVYLYSFNWKVPRDGGIWGSPHTVDIPFALGSVEAAHAMTGRDPGPVEVSRNMMSAFAAFARTDDPANPRMPDWKPYNSETRATMLIDDQCRLVNDYRGTTRAASATFSDQSPAALLRGPLFRGVA